MPCRSCAKSMRKPEDDLERLIALTRDGGFGDPDALDQHLREINHIRFKITQRNNIRIGLLSALVGAAVGGAVGGVVSAFVSSIFL